VYALTERTHSETPTDPGRMEAQGKPAHAEADQAKSENIGGSMNRQGEISTARVSETGEGSSSRRSSSSGSSCSSEDSIPESDCDGTSIFQLLRESKQAPALRRLQRTPPELPPDAVDPGSGWALLHFTGYYGWVFQIQGNTLTGHLVC
jgi:hypothetical protein